MDFFQQTFNFTKSYFASCPAPQYVVCNYIPEGVCNYMTAHPYATAAQVVAAVPLLVPAAVAAPVLGVFGFKAAGIAAGSSAAAYQSAHGATWAFSWLQSAGAGGYAVPVINGIVTGTGGVAMAVAEWFKWA